MWFLKRRIQGIIGGLMNEAIQSPSREAQTGRSLLWTGLLSEPLFTLYGFIAFILYKDLGAGAFQIALLTMLKPVITILSFYWSAGLKGRCRKIKSNVLWAGFWMRAPFLLCPFIDSAWYLIGAAVNYMFFYRAGIPGWLEMIKRNMQEEKRGKIFSLSSGLAYAEGVVISMAVGAILDHDPMLWKGLFVAASLIGLTALLVQSKLQIDIEEEVDPAVGIKERLIRPWRDSYRLMKNRPDFSKFQWGFMIAGFGIMLIQPAIPLFAVDTLKISYTEMAAAISIAKGLGFSLSSPFWGRWMEKKNIFKLASSIFIAFALFPLIMSFSVASLGWFYLSYFCYGIAQGGSHLVWNLSGPIFSGNEESSRYTGVNVALAGLRGAVAPPLGGMLVVSLGPIAVLILGGAFCLSGGIWLFQKKREEKKFVEKSSSSL